MMNLVEWEMGIPAVRVDVVWALSIIVSDRLTEMTLFIIMEKRLM